MFVVERTVKLEKGFIDIHKEKMNEYSPIFKSPGFVKREVLISTTNKEFDLIKTLVYFNDKKAYYVWEGSPEHIKMHKEKKENPVKPVEVISVERNYYEHFITNMHE